MKVVAYCRVSTDNRDQLNSYENQLSYFNREITSKGHEQIEIYADRGISGTTFSNRPAFEQMLYDAGLDIKRVGNQQDKRKKAQHTIYEVSDRTPKFEEIWLKNTSRFARNTLSYEIIQNLRTKKVYVYFIEQNLNTRDTTKDFHLQLYQLFDAQESRDRSSKTIWGMKETSRNGGIFVSGNIYGYKYIKETNSLKAIPEEAEVIRVIFNLYEQGLGVRRLINALNEQGITTRKGKPFTKSSLNKILTNEKYAGLNNPFRYDTAKVSDTSYTHRMNQDYEVKPSDRIEAIITPEQFYKCKKTQTERINYQKRVGKYSGTTKFAGLITCGICGAKYHANINGDRRFYWCSSKAKYGSGACTNKNVSGKKLDALIDHLISGAYKEMLDGQNDALIFSFYLKLRRLRDAYGKWDNSELEQIKEKIEKEESRSKRLLFLYADGYESLNSFKAVQKEIDDNIVELKKEFERKADPVRTMRAELEELIEAIRGLQALNETPAPTTEAEMIDSISQLIAQNGHVYCKLKVPEIVLKCLARIGKGEYKDLGISLQGREWEQAIDQEIELARRTIHGNVPQ